MTEFTPGIYPHMPDPEYRLIPALNQSTIKVIDERHVHAGWEKLHRPTPPTQAMIEGTAFHYLVLEPHLYDKAFVSVPMQEENPEKVVIKRGKENLAIWADWEKVNKDRYGLKPEKIIELKEQAKRIREHPVLGQWIAEAEMREFVVLWEHPIYGFPCKAKVDAVTVEDWTWVWDLKSTRDASEGFWKKEIANKNYLVQAEWTLQGLNEISEHDRRFAFAACETTGYMDIGIYECGATTRFEAKHRIDSVCRKWADALERNAFDGMPVDVREIEVPNWAMTHLRDLPDDEELEL